MTSLPIYFGGSMERIQIIIAYIILLLLGVAMVFTIYGAWRYGSMPAGIMALVWVCFFRYTLTLFK